MDGCQKDSLTGKWIISESSRVVFNGSNITYFEKGSSKETFNFRIVKNGNFEEGFILLIELSDPKSSYVKTVAFKNIDDYQSIIISGRVYFPSGIWRF